MVGNHGRAGAVAFERLPRNYAGHDRIAVENIAIADHDGVVPFYHLAESEEDSAELPTWYDAIGSLSRDIVLRSSASGEIADVEERLVSTTVPCMTFESLCPKHDLQRLDLVLTDAEGY